MHNSRRHFLQAASGLAAMAAGPMGSRFSVPLATSLAGIGAMAAQNAAAATTTGPYRALVCLYMHGGNDSHNWVVPTHSDGYAEYAAARQDLAVPANKLLNMTLGSGGTAQGAGRSFGMPRELQPLHELYESGRCAVMANVGPLERPVTKADFLASNNLPKRLFSHNDQESIWQSLSPEGARSGWGGRMGDLFMSANRYPAFTAVSASGNAVFLTGSTLTQYQVGADGPVRIAALGKSWVQGSTALPTALQAMLRQSGSNDFQAEYARVMQRSLDTTATLSAALGQTAVPALPTTPLSLPSGSTLALDRDSLARQLRVVAQMVAAAPGLGMRRQVFMVSIGGFDAHANQMRDQPTLMSRVAHSVGWFQSTLQSLGLGSNVTLFTASDFGRTLSSNGSGSDHGWGGHQFVLGDAVNGKRIYGRMPLTTFGTADDLGSGRLLPGTSVTEYAATLGQWMGLSTTELDMVLPNRRNFSTSTGATFL